MFSFFPVSAFLFSSRLWWAAWFSFMQCFWSKVFALKQSCPLQACGGTVRGNLKKKKKPLYVFAWNTCCSGVLFQCYISYYTCGIYEARNSVYITALVFAIFARWLLLHCLTWHFFLFFFTCCALSWLSKNNLSLKWTICLLYYITGKVNQTFKLAELRRSDVTSEAFVMHLCCSKVN